LSIITVNLNNLEGLKKTMASVFNQTWRDFEYIVIDGGSTDGSKEYIEQHADMLDYWVSEPDKGIYNAMNKGILKASGEFLLFLNSGDHLIENTILEQNYKYIVKYDLIYFDLKVVNNEKSFIKRYPNKLSFSYFLKDTLPHPATFIRRSLFGNLGCYDESLRIVSDWKFFIEAICKNNVTYNRVNNILSTFYLDGMSSSKENKEIIKTEKNNVLISSFSTLIEDFRRLNLLEKKVQAFKGSKKYKLLVKFRLINKL